MELPLAKSSALKMDYICTVTFTLCRNTVKRSSGHPPHPPGPEVCGAAGEQAVVWVPVERSDGGLDGLLDVLAQPPVVALLKVAHRHQLGTTAHCKLVLCTTK